MYVCFLVATSSSSSPTPLFQTSTRISTLISLHFYNNFGWWILVLYQFYQFNEWYKMAATWTKIPNRNENARADLVWNCASLQWNGDCLCILYKRKNCGHNIINEMNIDKHANNKLPLAHSTKSKVYLIGF